MKDGEKAEEKKMHAAKKMFRKDEECEHCGKHHKSKDHEWTEDKFSKKDKKKEKKDWKEKGGGDYAN